ncbi:cation:proton antiporter, partial [Conexibacter sp. CPCC 205706]|uniref:cation:proton antiporter domain-containing protein n=1 Tax=Conexibacter sp. CPCC 205706 TaxID=3064572 RepID=UPI00271E9B62
LRLGGGRGRRGGGSGAPGGGERGRRGRTRTLSAEQLERLRTRVRRALADIDYFLAMPLGWRDGTVVVWAGMRGAITLAAAQTLPEDTPDRELLILVAFLVGAGSLLLQGSTLPRLVRVLGTTREDRDEADAAERERLTTLLRAAAEDALLAHPVDHDGERTAEQALAWKRQRLAVIDAQRAALLDARDDGAFSAAALNSALATLDADQISLELKGRPADA